MVRLEIKKNPYYTSGYKSHIAKPVLWNWVRFKIYFLIDLLSHLILLFL